MAVAQDSYTGNGTKTVYTYNFPYLKQSEVKASLDGTATTAFTHPTATSIQFNTAPANGVKIKIYRETETSSLAATFYAGSSIKSQDLNDNFTQNLYATQEVTERYVSNLGGTMTGDLNLGEDVVVKFEGATDNTYETTLTVADPTADRTITLPNVTGTVVTTGDTGTVATGMIAADAVTGAKIADDAINSEHYTDGSIDTAHIADAQITAAKLATDSVTTAKITDANVTTAKIADLNVTTAKIAADAITGAKIGDMQINSEHYVHGSIDTAHIGADQVTGAKIADDQINSEHYVDGSIDTQHIADAQITHVKLANDCIDGDNIQDDVVNSEHYAAGSIDTEHIADGQITAAKLHADAVVTNSEQAGVTTNDTSFFTTSAGDARYYRLGSVEEIQSGETWVAADNKVATTSAIDARITDLVDDVGGFVPIANETSFPNANPDVNNGAGTLVSIKALANAVVSNVSGVATISNGTVGNSTVTITGLAASTTYAASFGMIVETTSTLNTYTFHRVVPKATEVTTVSTNITNINAVANNNNNINNVANNSTNINTVATNATNINTVAAANTNITTVAGNNTNINTVAGANTNISTVATNITNVNNVGGSIANVNSVASNLASVNNFADQYRIASSQPSSSLNTGDLYFDTTANELRVYNGSSWQGGVTATGNLVSKADIGASSGVPGSGSNGQYLKTNGSGTLSWGTIDLTNLNASNLTSGTVATARLGSGTASSSTYLKGDGTWGAITQATALAETEQAISSNYTISTNKNAMSVGDVTVNSGIVLTIPSNSKYIVLN